ncbi:MAG: ABC transporter permease [Geodermatophilaceae bacterium]|nr:ABC transporter permease [Geodermatophilaceae bacterium]
MTRSHLLAAAISAEARKIRSARAGVATLIMLDVGIVLVCIAAVLGARSDDIALAAKLGPLVAEGGWAGYLSASAQVTAVAGLLGFGVVLAWQFGREFSDGTVTGLFAIPVQRRTLAAAKLLVYLCWAFVVSSGLILALLIGGVSFGLGLPGSEVWPLLARMYGLALLTAGLAIPAAWAATLGRGLLSGIATIIGVIVLAQVAVFSGLGGWFPFSAPGLWAATNGHSVVSAGQLALVLPVAATFVGLTLRSWHRLQLDR